MLFRVLLLCLLACQVQAQTTQPNIVLILVDDFSMNLMPFDHDGRRGYMPNLKKLMADGLTMDDYFVTDSQCCPSRASLFTGMLPHNTGVLTNTAPDGGLGAFSLNEDEQKVFALPLQAAGYQTAMMGKYLNGYLPQHTPQPPGWSDWVSTSNGYKGYGYIGNHNGAVETPAEHFTDYIARLGRHFIGDARQPFFLELASFSPHSPYIPPSRYDSMFLDVNMPHTEAYDRPADATAPQWLKDLAPLTDGDKAKMEGFYRMRLQADMGIDDMIGSIRKKLARAGLADNTYVIFTSDNGYHLGEQMMHAGKMTPFDMDVRVPFVIVGPGIEPGSHSSALAMNIDLAPTFLDMAGLPVPDTMDGRSLLPVFHGGTNSRLMAVIEHKQTDRSPDDPDNEGVKAADPPDYVALRFPNALYVVYTTGETGYYQTDTDPEQLHNVIDTLTQEQRDALFDAAARNAACIGAIQCGAAQNGQ